MYYAELAEASKSQFSSIPDAFWWGIVTMTVRVQYCLSWNNSIIIYNTEVRSTNFHKIIYFSMQG